MSKIVAINNLQNQSWEITEHDLLLNNPTVTYADLFIKFIENDSNSIVEFKDLKFKYELKHNGNVIQSNSYPPPNVKYVMSDQDYLITERLTLESEKNYILYFWAENNNISSEITFNFTTP
jgi:hypothetical protein